MNEQLALKYLELVIIFKTRARWCAEGGTNCVCLRAQNLVNLPSLRSGNFDEKTKKIIEKKLRKMKIIFSAEKLRRQT